MVRSFSKVTTFTIVLMVTAIALALVAKSYASSHLSKSSFGAKSQSIQILPSTDLSANAAGSDTVPVIVNGSRHDIDAGDSQTFSDDSATTTVTNTGSGVTTTTTTNPPSSIQTNGKGNGNVSVTTTTNNTNSNSQSYSGISSSTSSWSTNGGQSFVYSNGNGNVTVTH
jgi:hypothetical protein